MLIHGSPIILTDPTPLMVIGSLPSLPTLRRLKVPE